MARFDKDIPPLLHDARLSDCRWDGHLKTFVLSFQCLRRNLDGTNIENSTVNLKLSDVARIQTHYSPASVTVKPSEFVTGSRLKRTDLDEWRHGAVDASLAINSPQAEFEMETAYARELLVGDLESCPHESPLRVHITFEPNNYGPQGTPTGLSIGCDSLATFAIGVPLDIETWKLQFENTPKATMSRRPGMKKPSSPMDYGGLDRVGQVPLGRKGGRGSGLPTNSRSGRPGPTAGICRGD